jgi:RNA polymerase sigma-70 factor (ECF subfamily)
VSHAADPCKRKRNRSGTSSVTLIGGDRLSDTDSLRAAVDRQDAARVLAGDAAAFEGIVRRWQSPLINLAYRFCRDRGRAEEMAQEAFLRAFRNLGSWRQESVFSTWLFALATNLYCTELRRHPPVTLPFDEVHEPADPHAVDGGLTERNQNAAIHHAVQSLPPKYREVLTLYYFHEMDVPSAARSLGLPEGTVKAHLFRARNLLRNKLKPLFGERAAAQAARQPAPPAVRCL